MHTQPTATLPKGAQVRIACRHFPMKGGVGLDGIATVRIDGNGRYEFTTCNNIGAGGFIDATVTGHEPGYGVNVVLNNGYVDLALNVDPKAVLPVDAARAAA